MMRARTAFRKSHSAKPCLERLEDRLAPAALLPGQNGLFVVPGPRGEQVTLTFQATGGDSTFANEVGVFVVDGPRGRIGNVLPGQPAYARRVVASPQHQLLFEPGAPSGVVKQLTFTAGQRLGFYVIRGGTAQQFLSINPRNVLKRGPVAIFSTPRANPDGLQHLRARALGGSFTFGWEDSLFAWKMPPFGMQNDLVSRRFDYNDVMFRVTVDASIPNPPVPGEIPGPAGDLVNTHIHNLAIPNPAAGDLAVDNRPNGTGLVTSRTRIMVQFTDTATVGAVNALLQSINAHILGTVSDIGLVVIGIPGSGNFTDLDRALATLQSDPAVALAVQDVALGITRLPAPTTAQDPAGNPWLWSNPPSDVAGGLDGNWGLEAVRAPQMWSLNDYGEDPANSNRPRTGILDAGFNDVNADGTNDHPDADVPGLRTWVRVGNTFQLGAVVNDHGQHVAGIIGADFHNQVGVEGINPFAAGHSPADDQFIGVSHSSVAIPTGLPLEGELIALFSPMLADLDLMLEHWPDLSVVNISLGYNWASNSYDDALGQSTLDPNTHAAAQAAVAAQGLIVRQIAARHPNTIIVAAAGNDSAAWTGYANEIDARWASPFSWAARGPNTFIGDASWLRSPNILAVESIDPLVAVEVVPVPSYRWHYYKSDFSNVGGDVSAPGGNVLSTVGNNIQRDNDHDGLIDEDPINPSIDDDGDGRFDEDPIDFPSIDNDGDGLFDEDPVTSIDDDGDGQFDEDPIDFANYLTYSGTSMAAPHVTGLIGYLLTLNPNLTVAQIRTLLTQPEYTHNTLAQPGDSPFPATIVNQTTAPMIDAFAAAMGIDLVTNDAGKSIQRALVDVDDGTADGNLRVDPLTGDAVTQIFTADARRGDGKITMRDFRAWRDAYLQVQGAHFIEAGLSVALDGASNHVKKDLNFNGVVATDDDYLYPRYDFNGDGLLAAWWAQAPFKIDPDTNPPPTPPGEPNLQNKSTELQPAPGFLRDIDVLADPTLWSDVEVDDYFEAVTLFPELEQVDPGPESTWNEWRYLLANRDPDSASDFLKELPDYIHSFDVHVSIDWTALDYGDNAILLRIDSEKAGPNFAQTFRREAIVPAGTADFVVTIPVWTGNVEVRVAGFNRNDDSLPNLDLGEPREDWTGVKIGEDKALKLGARDYKITNFNDLLAPYGITYSYAAAINNLGDVVLETNYPGTEGVHLFLVERSSGVITHLNPLIGGDNLGASAINNSRQIAGTRYDEQFEIESGFIYQYGETPSLIEVGARHKPLDINEAGDVVGYIYNPDSNNRGFLRHRDGTIELIGDRATGINNLGHVVGNLGARVFVDRGAGPIDIGLPPGQTAGALRDPKINDAGQIAGVYSPPGSPFQPTLYAPFIWNDGVWTFPFLSPFGGISYFGGQVYDVSFNESGVGVFNTGFFVFDSTSSYYAWRFDENGGSRLSNLDPPDSPFSMIDYAGDINDRGDIVGYGKLPDHRHGGFVLTRVL